MQSEPPEHGVPTSSPPIPTFRPAPTPTQTAFGRQRPPSASPSRSRATQPRDEMLSLTIQTPHSDLGQARPQAWNVSSNSTIRDVKDAIASGAAGYGQWERVGLRLVWRGRMLRDEDVLHSVFVGETQPTVILVARSIAPVVQVPVAAVKDTQEATVSAPHLPTAAAVALTDCVHYLLFSSREHLCHLLGSPVLKWEDTHPKPTVSRDSARVAVMSVVRGCLAHLEWEGAFDNDPEAVWTRLGRSGVSNEVRTLWSTNVGRDYSSSGESTPVELDRKTYQLVLPPLPTMSPSQLVHLLMYLRINTLLPSLYTCLTAAQAPPASSPAPTPTTTATAPANGNANPTNIPRGVQVHRIRPLQIPRIPLAWAQHQFFSALRMATMIYMLVGGLAFADPRLWLIFGAAAAWWVADGITQWESIRQREALERRNAPNPDGAAAPPAPGAGAGAGAAAEENPLDPALMAAEQPRPNGPQRNPRDQRLAQATLADILKLVPIVNLDHDLMYLRLPATQDQRAAQQPGPIPTTRPNFWICRVLLPVYLWFITLVPAFESTRARAIRQRERTMRSMVTALTPPDGDRVLPDGLLSQAKAYYLRVVSREETIDWEEEREAQRAMGIRDEEAVPML